MPRVGMLMPGPAAHSAAILDPFYRGLHELGYVEGQNLALERRYGDWKPDRGGGTTYWEGKSMTHFAFGTVLLVMLCVPFVSSSYNEASAQDRETCSQARSHCGTQRVCQRRYETCMQTGCWTVGPVKRCGYQQQ
jgi:hypothetical protein